MGPVGPVPSKTKGPNYLGPPLNTAKFSSIFFHFTENATQRFVLLKLTMLTDTKHRSRATCIIGATSNIACRPIQSLFLSVNLWPDSHWHRPGGPFLQFRRLIKIPVVALYWVWSRDTFAASFGCSKAKWLSASDGAFPLGSAPEPHWGSATRPHYRLVLLRSP